jgi:catechol 2,3-dioxygenase-like lactoylglutathione lyase family enzyme
MRADVEPPTWRLDQVGIVVPDLESALQRYSETFAVQSWSCWTFGPELMTEARYRGEPGRFRWRVALGGEAPQIELIEPLAGPSVYYDWLDAHGAGIHHLGMRVPSLDDAVRSMSAAGYEVVQSGRGYGVGGDGGFAYFDTAADYGAMLEVIEVPQRRHPPDFVKERTR